MAKKGLAPVKTEAECLAEIDAAPDPFAETETKPEPEFQPPAVETPGLPGGLEDMDKSDIVIPRLRVVQPTSKEGTPGKLRLNLTGDEFDQLTVVFIKATKGRVLFDRENLGSPPLCGSLDRVRPSNFFESPISDRCGQCPMAGWTKDNGRNAPPECNESYTLLGLDVDNRIPFFFQTRSTGIRPTKLFLSAVFFQAKRRNADLVDFQVTLKTKETVGEKGKFYVPVFEKPVYLKDRPYREEAAAYAREEAGFEPEESQSLVDQGASAAAPGNCGPF
ncbi:MAG: hypothetical protein C4575_09515 [Desulforudis sp.]|nr:MAG: hypothetical protein C4575_09515 [Desulforudis sp.]